MENKLKKKFDPSGFQTAIGGKVFRIVELSRDDLLQIACEGMMAMERVDEINRKLASLVETYREGKIEDDPSPVEYARDQCVAAAEAIREIEGPEAKTARANVLDVARVLSLIGR